jgi:hypothetical protein
LDHVLFMEVCQKFECTIGVVSFDKAYSSLVLFLIYLSFNQGFMNYTSTIVVVNTSPFAQAII